MHWVASCLKLNRFEGELGVTDRCDQHIAGVLVFFEISLPLPKYLLLFYYRCKMYPDMSYAESSVVLGVGPEKTSFGAMEMGESPAENGCKCGPDCKCNPCKCGK